MTIDVKRLRELEAKATPGPWKATEEYRNGMRWHLEMDAPNDEPGCVTPVSRHRSGDSVKVRTEEDAALIVEMRNALPALLDELEAHKSALAKAVGALEGGIALAQGQSTHGIGCKCPRCSAMRIVLADPLALSAAAEWRAMQEVAEAAERFMTTDNLECDCCICLEHGPPLDDALAALDRARGGK